MAVDKLVDSTQLNADLTSVADAIRTKGGTSAQLAFPSGFVSAINAISTGGGGEPVTEKQINFIDYDGTILHSYTASEWASVTALPSNPSHTGLTSQGWNWTKAEIDAQLTDVPDGDIFVGQMYVTDDGKTRLYCHFEEGRLHPYLGIGLNGTVVVDWGDNSATATLTGTGLTTAQVADHVYASGGDYMITLTVTSGSAQIYGNSSTTFLLRKSGSSSSYDTRVYSNSLVKVQLGTDIGIGNYAFLSCTALASITIPSGVTSIGTDAFSGCYSLASITIPSGVTGISSNAFRSCYSLASITIPSGVTNIYAGAFNNDYGLGEIHFKPTTPPTCANSNAWTNLQKDCIIYVPTGSLSAYTSAAKYPSSSTYTYIEE